MAKKKNKSPSTLILTTLVALALVLLGIFFYKNTPTNSDTPGLTQLEGTIMDDFPEFPIYPNANVESSQRTEAYGTEPVSYQAYFESTDTVAAIVKWYKENLVEEGWTIDEDTDTAQADEQNISVSKDNQMATIFVENEGQTSFISIHIQ